MEIERKFLVDIDKFKSAKFNISWTTSIEQGYLSKNIDMTIRVRIEDNRSYITIKGPTQNISREEFEYDIPLEDAESLIKMCDKTISKKRTTIKYKGKYWEVDIFEGDNEGLVVAEIELKDEDEKIDIPSWVTTEVSNDSRYYNARLIDEPYKNWQC